MLVLSLALLSFTFTGCATVVVEAGNRTYNHLRGDLLGIVPDSLTDTYSATFSALEEISHFEITDKKVNALNAQVIAYDNDARKVQVDLCRTEEDKTSVQIRIGLIGDKVESVMIYDHIRKYLPSTRNI